ncbi:MAG: DsrE family protein [Hyphomicrobiaceae bacterium]|nr:DsrE family protein [Hyphomicrobiaceae bacterium]
MKTMKSALLVAVLTLASLAEVSAGSNDPLFVNLLTSDAHRARMAVVFSKNQLERGHPVTFFLNDKGVLLLSKRNAKKFAEHQKLLGELMQKGAVVLACPMCMQHYGVKETDLIEGAKVGNPELTGSALFKDNTKTLTW